MDAKSYRMDLLHRFLRFLREAAGEYDYQRYHAAALSRGELPVDAQTYYLASLDRKYSHPNRCC